MRLSIRPDDSGYRADWREFQVLLDGRHVRFMETADDEAGFVTVIVSGTKDYERKTLTGTISIRKRTSRASAETPAPFVS